MSGSVPKGLDGIAYQRLVKIAKEAGKPVILDTSGKLLEMGIEACPTLIKPNIDEIRMLTGKHCDDIQDIIDAAKAIHAKGVEIVAVSSEQMVPWQSVMKELTVRSFRRSMQ